MCKSVVGLKFNKLTILEDLGKKVRCSCECGGEKIAQKGHVTNNLTTSCGCAKRKGNLVGQTFSYLTVVGFEKNSGYICKCKCGATTISSGRKLELGQKKSCGKCNCKAEDLEKLIIGQTCKITNGDERLVVDHCHKTGFVRGVIQNNINSGIGLFKEDANLIEKAILYLSEALCHS